jgi:zinc/manganese transport system substrate-binding protein
VADAITSALVKADGAGASGFRANDVRFQSRLKELIAQESTDRVTTQGAGVAITEPVPLYLLDALGAVNKTPAAFSKAVEGGSDVSPAVLPQTVDRLDRHEVKVLVYNAQTTDAQTQELQRAAQSAHVPVVPVTETLPPGKNYLTWMTDNVAAISAALAS